MMMVLPPPRNAIKLTRTKRSAMYEDDEKEEARRRARGASQFWEISL